MRRAILVLATLILAGIAWTPSALAEKRVALVIGNSAYDKITPLKNPKNDAEAVATTLAHLGFDVIKGVDLDHEKFAQTVREFARSLEGADTAVLFYAGHGLQVNNRNYLAPIDAKLENEADLDFQMIQVETILTQMEREPRINIVFLDACRDNPLARNLARSMGTRSAAIGHGLARVETGIGTLIAFATQPGNVALDGDSEHSPFTAALLKHIETPGLDISILMRKVRQDVIAATSSRQVPWDNSSLTADFAFVAPEPVAPPKSVEPVVVTVPKPERTSQYKPGDTFKDCDQCPEMVVVPAGEFMMGSPDEKELYEGPQHQVRIVAPFAVGKFEVTKDQFDAFIYSSGSGYDAGSKCGTYEKNEYDVRTGRSYSDPGFGQAGNEPAVCINWDDAKAYVNWLSNTTGKIYRLLSESEWEYAARAGSQLSLVSAKRDGDLCANGNSFDITAKKALPTLNSFNGYVSPKTNCSDGYVYTSPAGIFAPNAFGLYDMQGNVGEWIEDCYHASYRGAPSDGSAWVSGGDCSKRVLRGGSWLSSLRSAEHRSNEETGDPRASDAGFRVARTLTP
jgi:formylglycine-generating enzyme required for sulfatase activity